MNVDMDTQNEVFEQCSSIFWTNFKNNSVYVEQILNPYNL